MFNAEAWRAKARIVLNIVHFDANDLVAEAKNLLEWRRAEATMESLPYFIAAALKSGNDSIKVMNLCRHDDYEWERINPDSSGLPIHTMGDLCGAGKLVFDCCASLGLKPKIAAIDWTSFIIEISTPREL